MAFCCLYYQTVIFVLTEKGLIQIALILFAIEGINAEGVADIADTALEMLDKSLLWMKL